MSIPGDIKPDCRQSWAPAPALRGRFQALGSISRGLHQPLLLVVGVADTPGPLVLTWWR